MLKLIILQTTYAILTTYARIIIKQTQDTLIELYYFQTRFKFNQFIVIISSHYDTRRAKITERYPKVFEVDSHKREGRSWKTRTGGVRANLSNKPVVVIVAAFRHGGDPDR